MKSKRDSESRVTDPFLSLVEEPTSESPKTVPADGSMGRSSAASKSKKRPHRQPLQAPQSSEGSGNNKKTLTPKEPTRFANPLDADDQAEDLEQKSSPGPLFATNDSPTEMWTTDGITAGQTQKIQAKKQSAPQIKGDAGEMSWACKSDSKQIEGVLGEFDGKSKPVTIENEADWFFEEELDEYRFESPQPDNDSPHVVFDHEAALRGQILVFVKKAGIVVLLLIAVLFVFVSISGNEVNPGENADLENGVESPLAAAEGKPQSADRTDRVQPSSPNPATIRGWIRASGRMLRRKQFSRALNKLKRWIKAAPSSSQLHYQYARALSAREKPQVALAINNYKKAIALDSNFADPYYHLSLLYIKIRKPEQAQAALDSFRRLRPKDKRVANAQKRIRLLN